MNIILNHKDKVAILLEKLDIRSKTWKKKYLGKVFIGGEIRFAEIFGDKIVLLYSPEWTDKQFIKYHSLREMDEKNTNINIDS